MERIKQIVPNMQSGGLETFIMNMYRNIDRSKFQFDFIVHYRERKFYDDEIEKMGGKIYRFSLRNDNNIIKYIIELDAFFKKHKEYKIIHCHMASIGFLAFLLAIKKGLKIRIAHSHNASTEKTLKGIVKSILIKPYKYMSTYRLACSQNAGRFLFKNKRPKIDIQIRTALNLTDKFVIGHVGRFNIQKNHEFLIDLFYNFKQEFNDAILILVGIGELETKIKSKVNKLEINDSVKFLGEVKNVDELYQGFDCFILPSLFEGLPVSGIEAQVSNLPCLFSDVITKESKINKNTFFLNINNMSEWITELRNIKEKLLSERNNKDVIKDRSFDIKPVVNRLEEIYLELIKNYM